MELLTHLATGFATVLTPGYLLICVAGVVLGTTIGVLPGIGPVGGVTLILPLTFGMDATAAIIMLAGIYYGTMYGGSTTSILMNLPGEAASVVTCIDGYKMAQQGRAGPALTIAAIGSFVAGTFSVLALMLMAPTLARVALRLGPPEFTALMVFAFVMIAYMSSTSLARSLAMATFGLLLATIGLDPVDATSRFTFRLLELSEGVSFVPVAMGLFGLAEILASMGERQARPVQKPTLAALLLTREDVRRAAGPIARGSVFGFLIGLIPGSPPVIASFMSYVIERRLSREPGRFGHGAIEGVAGPEAANNAATGGAMVPLVALGLPSGAVAGVMMVALLVHGIQPGPLFIREHPDVFWGLVASMYIGNGLLLILNLPLVGLFVNILRIPYHYLYPAIIVLCCVGAYAVRNSLWDLGLLVVSGAAGYLFRRAGFDSTPLLIGLILGPVFETAARQSLMMAEGSLVVFFTRPMSAIILAAAAALLVMNVVPSIRRASHELRGSTG